MAITKLNAGDTYTAAHDAAIIDALESTSTGHDHDGSDSKGTINPTTITCSGATTLSGACTLGDGDDNVTINAGTGTLNVNADRFLYDLDSTTASDGININRNVAATGVVPVVSITQDHASDDQHALQITNNGTGSGIKVTQTNAASSAGYFYTNAVHTGTGTNSVLAAVSNNASASGTLVHIQNDGTGIGLDIDQNANAKALDIVSTATSVPLVYLYSNAIHTGSGVNSLLAIKQAHADATGTCLYITSDQDASATSAMVQFESTDANNVQPVLTLSNAGTGPALYADQNASGFAIEANKNVASSSSPVVIITQDAIDGTGSCLELKQDDTDEPFIDFTGNDTGSVATQSGASDASVTVELNGTDYKIPLFAV